MQGPIYCANDAIIVVKEQMKKHSSNYWHGFAIVLFHSGVTGACPMTTDLIMAMMSECENSSSNNNNNFFFFFYPPADGEK